MQKNLWHFGDSFGNACPEEHHHIFKIAKRNNLYYHDCILTGKSNLMILNYLIRYMHKMTEGDLVYIHWSFFQRGEYIDDDMDLQSTNIWYDETHKNLHSGSENLMFSHRNTILNYFLNFNFDSTIKLFNWQVKPILDYLKTKKVTVVNSFIEKDPLYLNGIEFKKGSEIILENEISFGNEDNPQYFKNYLEQRGWRKEECCHYTNGIQEELSTIIELKIKKYYSFE
jgi:hypothetical protein